MDRVGVGLWNFDWLVRTDVALSPRRFYWIIFTLNDTLDSVCCLMLKAWRLMDVSIFRSKGKTYCESETMDNIQNIGDAYCNRPSLIRPCHGAGGHSPACHRGGPSSILDQSTWDLWWTKWHLDTSIFPCQYHSTNSPYSIIHLSPIL
jgi:hypothetical protein